MTHRANLKMVALSALIVVGAGAAMAKSGDHAKAFERIDANADGQITQEEMTAHATARFESVDTDGDGFLTTQELDAARDARAAKRQARMIERLDTDSDGKVSLAEMNTRRDPARLFERLDADENGTLSADEFAKARHNGKRGGDKAPSE